jgi:hypothetical protein
LVFITQNDYTVVTSETMLSTILQFIYRVENENKCKLLDVRGRPGG